MVTNLVVRNVDENVILRLKKRAAAHNRSAEEEHREILVAALMGTKRRSLFEVLRGMPDVGENSDFDCRSDSEHQH